MKTLSFTLDDIIEISARYPLNLFLRDWLNDLCEGRYHLMSTLNPRDCTQTIQIRFEEESDATFVKLAGIPDNLKKYLRPKYH